MFTMNQEFAFLKIEDQIYLKESGLNVLRQLSVDFSRELPDAIVLPGNSAKPLVQLILPTLKLIAEQRNLEVPQFVRLNLSAQDRDIYILRLLERHYPGMDPLEATESYRERLVREGSTDISILNALYRFRMYGFKHATDLISFWSGEAYKSTSKLQDLLGRTPSLIIVDDYITQNASTLREVRHAYGKRLPAYILLGQNTTPDFIQRHDPLYIGLQDPYPPAPGGVVLGFYYRGVNQIPSHFPEALLGRTEGTKDRPQLYDDYSPTSVSSALRNDMTRIGEQIRGELCGS